MDNPVKLAETSKNMETIQIREDGEPVEASETLWN